jgi:hypothetical protein
MIAGVGGAGDANIQGACCGGGKDRFQKAKAIVPMEDQYNR